MRYSHSNSPTTLDTDNKFPLNLTKLKELLESGPDDLDKQHHHDHKQAKRGLKDKTHSEQNYTLHKSTSKNKENTKQQQPYLTNTPPGNQISSNEGKMQHPPTPPLPESEENESPLNLTYTHEKNKKVVPRLDFTKIKGRLDLAQAAADNAAKLRNKPARKQKKTFSVKNFHTDAASNQINAQGILKNQKNLNQSCIDLNDKQYF